MTLTDEQIRELSEAISLSDVAKYIEEHYEEYLQFLKENGLEENKK